MQTEKRMSTGRAVAIALAIVFAMGAVGNWLDQREQAAKPSAPPATVPAPAVPQPVPEPLPPDDTDAINAAILDLRSKGILYDWHLNPAAHVLSIAVLPGVVDEGYGDVSARALCLVLERHGVKTIGGKPPIIRLVRQPGDWRDLGSASCG